MSPLLTDLYQLTMIEAYLDCGATKPATFELFVRRLPKERNFLVAAGLEQVLDFLKNLHFPPHDLAWLEKSGHFGSKFLDYLANFRFCGDVHAMPEGTVFFANEPVLRVMAPLPQAQLVETRLINIVHYQTLVASKAARMVLAAPGKLLVDFGLRRAHGAEAGLMAARASYLAGFAGSATVLAEKDFGIPVYGTMAHSFIEIFDNEAQAFAAFARARPEHLILLIDTYDTERAAQIAADLAPRLKAAGVRLEGVRLDSGDLIALSKSVRHIFDAAGLTDVTIFASGGLDEGALQDFMEAGAPFDGFGLGTSLSTSADVPALDCVYKLQEYAGLPRRKRSPGKETWPGRKQVWRRFGPRGQMAGDIISVAEDAQEGEPLIVPVMEAGKRLAPPQPLAGLRARALEGYAQLPERLRRLEPGASYRVEAAKALAELAAAVDLRLAGAISQK